LLTALAQIEQFWKNFYKADRFYTQKWEIQQSRAQKQKMCDVTTLYDLWLLVACVLLPVSLRREACPVKCLNKRKSAKTVPDVKAARLLGRDNDTLSSRREAKLNLPFLLRLH